MYKKKHKNNDNNTNNNSEEIEGFVETLIFSPELNPFRTAAPFWGQTARILSNLSPNRDCGPKRVNLCATLTTGTPPLHRYFDRAYDRYTASRHVHEERRHRRTSYGMKPPLSTEMGIGSFDLRAFLHPNAPGMPPYRVIPGTTRRLASSFNSYFPAPPFFCIIILRRIGKNRH